MLRLLAVLSLVLLATSAPTPSDMIQAALTCIQENPGKEDCAYCMLSVILSYKEYGYADNVDDAMQILVDDPAIKSVIESMLWELYFALNYVYLSSNILYDLMAG